MPLATIIERVLRVLRDGLTLGELAELVHAMYPEHAPWQVMQTALTMDLATDSRGRLHLDRRKQ